MSLTRRDIKEIFAEVKANNALLDTCIGPHEFELIGPQKILSNKFRCKHCNGILRGELVHWYNRGVTHADFRSATTKPKHDNGTQI
jgi:hypothetical protein